MDWNVHWDEITPEAAHHVCWFMDTSYRQPGGFTEQLIRAMFKADLWNLQLLIEVFPAEGWAVHAYKHVDGGYERLKEIAKELE